MAIRYTEYEKKRWWFIGELAIHETSSFHDQLVMEKPISAAVETWGTFYPLATQEQIRDLIPLIWQVPVMKIKGIRQ
jgi:hypothetical protein